MAFVSDASVAAAWVLPDEDAALAELALDRLGAETAKVPAVFWHEVRNLLLSAERRGRIVGGHADASMARLRRLPIVCPAETDDREVMALARAHRLSAYDASYLALAIREGCALASLDRRLIAAAASEGVALFS
ncbi:MAG: type II toxin-antitoxin system VapC family toxin [Rhodospirillaceae bacterium]|nr:type II toxin-antitoxin system VapC family toxin [Rhodospirillaceae bacterium]